MNIQTTRTRGKGGTWTVRGYADGALREESVVVGDKWIAGEEQLRMKFRLMAAARSVASLAQSYSDAMGRS